MSTSQELLLQVRDLCVFFGRERILQHVDLEVSAHTIHAIVGPNGGGKTTFIRSLLGGLAHQGEIRFRFRHSGRIGYLPQFLEFDHQLPMTVRDFLTVVLQRQPVFAGICRRVRTQVDKLLAQTDCGHVADRLLGSLSGGELRRVLLAQALSPQPEVLLLDEPNSNVDARGARLFEQLLMGLRDEQGLTIIMVDHDIPSLLRIADQVTCLNREVIYSGSPQYLRDPQRLAQTFGSTDPEPC